MKRPERQSTLSSTAPGDYSEAGLHRALGLTSPDEPERLPISKIRRDGGTQPRAKLDPETIQDYAEDMARGDQFPPGLVFYDGADYWLARGFTRTAAAESLGWTEFDYIVKQGTRRDAILFSVGENADHGLRRTNEDKRRAVLTMLHDEEWGRQSSQYIADCCHVSHTFVDKIRLSPATVAGQGKPGEKKPETRIGADGREYRVDRLQKAARKRAKPKLSISLSEPAHNLDESELAGRYSDAQRPLSQSEQPITNNGVPTEEDTQQWIISQYRKLTGMVEERGQLGAARLSRSIVSDLTRSWGPKK